MSMIKKGYLKFSVGSLMFDVFRLYHFRIMDEVKIIFVGYIAKLPSGNPAADHDSSASGIPSRWWHIPRAGLTSLVFPIIFAGTPATLV